MEGSHAEYTEHLACEAAARMGRFRTGMGEDRQTSAIVLPVEVWCDRTAKPTGYGPSVYELPYYHEMLQVIVLRVVEVISNRLYISNRPYESCRGCLRSKLHTVVADMFPITVKQT